MLAGFAESDVTPSVGKSLNGLIARTSASTGVDTRLSVRALCLEDRRTRWLLVSLDVLGLPPLAADRIVGRIARQLDLPEEHVVLACTHTHSGPMTVRLRVLGPADEEYLLFLEDHVLQAAAQSHGVCLYGGCYAASFGEPPPLSPVDLPS